MKYQYVIACVDSPESATTVLTWAKYFAERLNHTEVMALHVAKDEGMLEWLTQLGVPYVHLQGEWRTAIAGLPTVFNGILAVTAVDSTAPRTSLTHPKTLLHEFKSCKIAYLCVDKHSKLNIQHSTLTLTHRREGKELLVWASYLARFLGSNIQIAHPDYHDQDLRMRWRNNIRFAEKLFSPLGIRYSTFIIQHSSFFTPPDLAVLEEMNPDLLIARATDTRDRDFFDLLMPLPEWRLLTHPSHIPLLLLNPRDDLYILCD